VVCTGEQALRLGGIVTEYEMGTLKVHEVENKGEY
jgi:hypothetical protein